MYLHDVTQTMSNMKTVMVIADVTALSVKVRNIEVLLSAFISTNNPDRYKFSYNEITVMVKLYEIAANFAGTPPLQDIDLVKPLNEITGPYVITTANSSFINAYIVRMTELISDIRDILRLGIMQIEYLNLRVCKVDAIFEDSFNKMKFMIYGVP